MEIISLNCQILDKIHKIHKFPNYLSANKCKPTNPKVSAPQLSQAIKLLVFILKIFYLKIFNKILVNIVQNPPISNDNLSSSIVSNQSPDDKIKDQKIKQLEEEKANLVKGYLII